jgi:hypothetical protein
MVDQIDRFGQILIAMEFHLLFNEIHPDRFFGGEWIRDSEDKGPSSWGLADEILTVASFKEEEFEMPTEALGELFDVFLPQMVRNDWQFGGADAAKTYSCRHGSCL